MATKKKQFCLNHPDRPAVFETDGNGAHQLLTFCEDCIPAHWR